MDKKITKNVEKIIEKNGWNIYEDKETIELEQYSPAGEDFIFTVSKDDAVNEIIDYARNFDAEEHAAMWYGANNGEPSSLRVLLEDADAIKEMLEKLAKDLEGVR